MLLSNVKIRRTAVIAEINEELLKQITKLRSDYEELNNRLTIKESELKTCINDRLDNIEKVLTKYSDTWKNNKSCIIECDEISFDDIIYDNIEVEPAFLPLLSNPLVQRLNYIKQLSLAYYAYPSATHTRFAHSLGVCRNIESALNNFFQRMIFYTKNGKDSFNITNEDRDKIILKAKTAAFLHDIGHGPFCHALDRYVGYSILDNALPDKYYTPIYISEYLDSSIRSMGLNPEDIKNILSKNRSDLTGYDNLIADLIDSPLDVDRIDYLARDARFTGLIEGYINVGTLINKMVVYFEDGKYMLAFKKAAIPYIEHFMYARDVMYIKCYENPIKIAADSMIIKALDDFISNNNLKNRIQDIVLLTDEQLINLIKLSSGQATTSREILEALFTRKIFELSYEAMLIKNDKNGARIEDLIKSISEGNFKYVYIDLIKSWEKEITRQTDSNRIKPWQIMISVSNPNVFLQREGASKILIKNNGKYSCEDLYDISPLLKAGFIDILRKSRMKIRLFLWPDLAKEDKEKLISNTRKFLDI
ncbi:MAG: hypothetical protein AB1641_25570 [Thermodesulfobacteriota bacterium]